MTIIDAIRIEQDFKVRLKFADVCGTSRAAVLKEVAEKYTKEEITEAYSIIANEKEKELETLKAIFLLAIKSKLDVTNAKNNN